ncbi:MAG: methyltransferase domain-containing protein [Rhizobiaceae bacterium]
MACNICGGTDFEGYRGRKGERCTSCGSKARHRIALMVYETHLLPLVRGGAKRVLHLAPEQFLYRELSEMVGAGYITSDASPERYPHAECLKLYFPQDFDLFPDGYFTAILHNHVLEHIPGHYGDHLIAFTRMLAPGGKMIFSVPGPYLDRQSVEGGEHLASDAERLEKFLQEDHYKMLGADFVDFLRGMEGGALISDGITPEIREQLNVRPGKAPFFVWQKQ